MSDVEFSSLLKLAQHEDLEKQKEGWGGLIQSNEKDAIEFIIEELDRDFLATLNKIQSSKNYYYISEKLFEYMSSILFSEDKWLALMNGSKRENRMLASEFFATIIGSQHRIELLRRCLDIILNHKNMKIRKRIMHKVMDFQFYAGTWNFDWLGEDIDNQPYMAILILRLREALNEINNNEKKMDLESIVSSVGILNHAIFAYDINPESLESLIFMAMEEGHSIDILWGDLIKIPDIFQIHEDDGHFGLHYLVHPYLNNSTNIDSRALVGLANEDEIVKYDILHGLTNLYENWHQWYLGDS